ncbi:hypothetical protein KC660_04940, partial [Candidatus Dojkabacteria bacterium]|nr:hypothetical protein [Candidatus Dojkabacteria bacterium]
FEDTEPIDELGLRMSKELQNKGGLKVSIVGTKTYRSIRKIPPLRPSETKMKTSVEPNKTLLILPLTGPGVLQVLDSDGVEHIYTSDPNLKTPPITGNSTITYSRIMGFDTITITDQNGNHTNIVRSANGTATMFDPKGRPFNIVVLKSGAVYDLYNIGISPAMTAAMIIEIADPLFVSS